MPEFLRRCMGAEFALAESCSISPLFSGETVMKWFCLSVAALLIAASTPLPGTAAADHHMAAFSDCAKACGACALACDQCAAHCAKMLADGKKEHLASLQTCQDCATHCAAAASIVGRQGPFSSLICTACADACKQCAAQCDKHKDDEHMKKCAEECRKCEKACREMLKHTASK